MYVQRNGQSIFYFVYFHARYTVGERFQVFSTLGKIHILLGPVASLPAIRASHPNGLGTLRLSACTPGFPDGAAVCFMFLQR